MQNLSPCLGEDLDRRVLLVSYMICGYTRIMIYTVPEPRNSPARGSVLNKTIHEV